MKERAAIKMENVCAGYGGRDILQEVNVDVLKGSFMGIIGPNGAGKTTFLRTVNGILPADGMLFLQGRRLSEMSRREISRTVAFVPQELDVPVAFNVAEFVALGRTAHIGGFARLSMHDREAVARALQQTDMTAFSERAVNELSAGEKQRAIIAMALAQDSSILLLDEPTAHLDIQHTWQILSLISRLRDKHELTVLLSLHDLNLAAEFCEHLILLDAGRIDCTGVVDEVLTPEILSRVYAHPVDVVTLPGGRRIIVPERPEFSLEHRQ